MTSRAFSHKEVLLALLVILVAAAVVIPVTIRLQSRKLAEVDVDRMRNIYLSLALYESEENGWLPPTLVELRERMLDDVPFLALDDPFTKGFDKYPAEPGLPGWRVNSPVRVSYSFLYSYVSAGKLKVKPWYELKYDPKVGLLADEWQAKIISPGEPFKAEVEGPVVRLNTDGAMFRFERKGKRPIGNSDDLFFNR